MEQRNQKEVENPDNLQEQKVKKPSILSQAVPYLFTVGILVYVFTGLSSNVVDERHTLHGGTWSELRSGGVRSASLEIRSTDGTLVYCGSEEGFEAGTRACPSGRDYEVRKHPDRDAVSIRRAEPSRIPDGSEVSVNYVKKVKLSEIWTMIRAADLRIFLPVMILHTLVFFFADVFSFGMAYKWFNAPGIRFREMMEVRGAPYVIQVGLAPLAEVLFPLYMWRVKKVPLTETVSSNIWTMIMDFSAIFTVVTPAVIYNLYIHTVVPALGPAWLAVCLAFWGLFFGSMIYWWSPPGKRAASRIGAGREQSKAQSGILQTLGGALQLLRTFSLARRNHYLCSYAARFVLLLSTLLSNYVALRALGSNPSMPLAVIGIPFVVFTIFLPVGVGGYGGPQLVAWFLFVKLGNAGTADQVIAYSLLWSTAFLAGRALIGLLFIRGFWARCFPEGFKL